jgi:hypothetical protein
MTTKLYIQEFVQSGPEVGRTSQMIRSEINIGNGFSFPTILSHIQNSNFFPTF